LELALILGSLAMVFYAGVAGHLENAWNPYVFAEDARIHIWPLLRYHDSNLFANDYVSRYLLDCFPTGYRTLFQVTGRSIDPRALSKILPYVLILVVLLAVGLAAYRLGGGAAAWSAIALCLASDVFFTRMTGAFPRAFAYPSLALAAAGLVLGRPYWVVLAVLVGAAFYPVAAIVAGLALASYLLLLPASDRGRAGAWSSKKRIFIVAVTAVGVALLVLPTAIRSMRYGPLLTPSDMEQYPEIRPGGRWLPDTRPPFHGFMFGSAREAWRLFADPQRPLVIEMDREVRSGWPQRKDYPVIILLVGLVSMIGGMATVGFGCLLLKEPAASRLMTLLAGTFVGHLLALHLAPYLFLPQRYLAYSIPVLAVIAFPAGASSLAGFLIRGRLQKWLRPSAIIAICGFSMLCLGTRDGSERGYSIRLSRNTSIYSFLGSLPQDSLIAGWPNGIVQNVPYLSARSVLLTEETHLVFHRAYADEMRRRIRALLDAYFATGPGPLLQLRDRFGVNYFVIDRSHYEGDRAAYFKPFDQWIEKAYADLGSFHPEVVRQIPAAEIFSEGSLVVLDLRRLRVREPD
jgi:hypothetical protein